MLRAVILGSMKKVTKKTKPKSKAKQLQTYAKKLQNKDTGKWGLAGY